MQPIIRINRVGIENIKNVRSGEFTGNLFYDQIADHLPIRKSDTDLNNRGFKESFEMKIDQYVNNEKANADILGFYGQNGSGKTAVFETFRILGCLLGRESSLPNKTENLIFDGQPSCTLTFEFAAIAEYKTFLIKYEVELTYEDEMMKVIREELFYKENVLKVRYKSMLNYRDRELYRNTKLVFNSKNQEGLASKAIAIHSGKSVLFHKEIQKQYKRILSVEEHLLLRLITETFADNLVVIPNIQHGEFSSKYFLPFSKRIAEYNFNVLRPFVVPLDIYDEIIKAVELKNTVFSCVIPGAEVIVHEHNEFLDNGEPGKRIELLIRKDGRSLPLRAESAGTLKIFAITSSLIAFNINPNSCVVIDEFDSGVFEFLLGEILSIFSESGKGQLIFTSHNLRALEVLPVQNIWFTTTNPSKRYIQMKYTSPTNNIRRKYYEAIQLGGMAESVYTQTNKTKIKKAFRKVGRLFE